MATQVGQDIKITRVFDAPLEKVWRAWTDPEALKLWWGPKTFTAPLIRIDFREGGKYLYCMRDPDGNDYYSTGEFQEIVPLKRIVFTDSFADPQGNVVPASYYHMDNIPEVLRVEVTFEEQAGKTRMTLLHIGMSAGENTDLAGQGWNESFDKLAESLR